MERDDSDGNEALSQVKDMVSGTLAGLFSKVVEYPFDTLKVFYQANELSAQPQSSWSYLRSIIREGGVSRIFQGLPAPLAGACVENLIVFWLFGLGERVLKQRRLDTQGISASEPLSAWQVSLAGGFAGIGTGLWLTPVELVKCKMQVSEASVYSSTFDCLRRTLRENPLELTRGLTATLGREVPGSMAYFVGYKSTCRLLCWCVGKTDGDDPPPWIVLTGGAGAGLAFWISIYPIDMAKTQMQVTGARAAGVASEGGGLNMVSVLSTRLRRYGLRGWYAGLGVTVPRAVLSNSIIFAVYEYSRNVLDYLVPGKKAAVSKSDDDDGDDDER